jgi:hypothetical protein
MEFVIEHSNTKRRIIGDFNICGTNNDLRKLAIQILMQIGDADAPNFSYGWVSITEPQPSLANTSPLAWDT